MTLILTYLNIFNKLEHIAQEILKTNKCKKIQRNIVLENKFKYSLLNRMVTIKKFSLIDLLILFVQS